MAEKEYICAYPNCLHHGEKVSASESVVIGNKHYHWDCAALKQEIQDCASTYVEYANNMTSEQEHRRLLETMKDIPNIMISGYDSQLYQQILCEQYGFWKYEMGEKAVTMGVSLYGEARTRKMECIWTSYPIKGAFKQ